MIAHGELSSWTGLVLTELAFRVFDAVMICLSKMRHVKNQGNNSWEKEMQTLQFHMLFSIPSHFLKGYFPLMKMYPQRQFNCINDCSYSS